MMLRKRLFNVLVPRQISFSEWWRGASIPGTVNRRIQGCMSPSGIRENGLCRALVHLLGCAVLSLCSMPTFAAVPRVVVSINPFYGLVASVMQGVGKPSLLVKIGASPHEYTLKPSEIRQLEAATLIFWGGPALESFLIKPLAQQKASLVAFDQVPGLHTLPLRTNMIWESQDEDSEVSGHHHHHHSHSDAHGSIDMHFWLDPHHAIAMTKAIVLQLSAVDPEHQSQYQANGQTLIQRLKQLDRTLQKNLASAKSKPFVVFHDAYQYFERRYHLQGAGSISLHPELPPSIKRLSTIRAIIEKQKVVCLFSEPQFSAALVHSIADDLPVRTGILDPIGTDASPEGYFTLMENLSEALTECLAK